MNHIIINNYLICMNEFYEMKLIEYTPKTLDIIKYIDIRLPL